MRPQRSQRSTMTMMVATMIVAIAAVDSAHGCSWGASDLDGLIDHSGGAIYLQPVRDDERPGTYRWLQFTPAGTLRSDQEITVPWADVSLSPIVATVDGRLWLRVSCYRAKEPLHCGTLQEIFADASLGRRIPLPPGHINLRIDGENVRYAVPRDGVLDIREIDLETGENGLSRRVSVGNRYPISGRGSHWALGPDGDVVLAFSSAGHHVTLVRLDDENQEVARARYPGARFGFDPVDEDGVRKLGPFWSMQIGDDGVVVAAQSAHDPSCHFYQSPSVAIFDRDLTLLGVAENEGRLRRLRRLGESLVVVGVYGSIKRFNLDGTLLDDWSPEIPVDGTETEWKGSWEEMRAAAAALDRESPPARRIALFEAAEDDKQALIDSWWVEEGPATYAVLTDVHWQRLAGRLCARHPEDAPDEALRRYDRSRGAGKEGWFEAIATCFERPVPRVYEHAIAAMKDDTSRAETEVLFVAWGYPQESMDALWRKVLETSFGRSKPALREANQLLNAFPQTAETFHQLLTSGTPAQLVRVQQILMESIYVWGKRYDYRADEVRAARNVLLRWAERWSASDQLHVAATGRLLRLGHLASDDHDSATFSLLVSELISSARREARMWPWIALALDEAIQDESTFRRLGDTNADWLVAASQEASPRPLGELMLDYASPDPWGFVLRHGGTRSASMLITFALSERATAAMRNRLLWRLAEVPWSVEPRQMRQLLEAPWLTSDGVDSAGLLAVLGAVAHEGGELQSILVDRFTELFAPERLRSRRGGSPNLYDPTMNLYGSPLIDGMGVEGVRSIVGHLEKASRVLRLIAQVGAWPAVEAQIEPLLDGPATNVKVEAAAALATSRNPKAFEILLTQLEQGRDVPLELEALAQYGEQTRAALAPLLSSDKRHIRMRARVALRAVGPTAKDIQSLEAVADAAFAEGELPDVATVLMLHESGRDALDRLVTYLAAHPAQNLRSFRLGYTGNHDFQAAVLDWLREAGDDAVEVPKSVLDLIPFVAPDARRWLAALEVRDRPDSTQ